jgi:hypothetical protein
MNTAALTTAQLAGDLPDADELDDPRDCGIAGIIRDRSRGIPVAGYPVRPDQNRETF